MNVLIVDDEVYVVRTIKKRLNWEKIGVDEVFIAFNAQKAKEILKENPVDIILTDVEMPGESGLELMKWVREQGFDCKSICLTCHMEFDYAREAVRLGFVEYIVKPVDFEALEQLLERVVLGIREERHQKEEASLGKLWFRDRGLIVSDFWKRLLEDENLTQIDGIMELAEQKRIAFPIDQTYRLLGIPVGRISQKAEKQIEDSTLFRYILCNIAGDIFLKEEDQNRIVNSQEYLWMIVADDGEELRERLFEYIDVLWNVAGVRLVIYAGMPCYGDELYGARKRLQQLDRENVSVTCGVIFEGEQEPSAQDVRQLFEKAAGCLTEQKKTELDMTLHTVKSVKLSRQQLFYGISLVNKALSAYQQKKNYSDSEIWTEKLQNQLLEAYTSVDAFADLLTGLYEQLDQVRSEDQEESPMITDMKRFVREHIEEKIGRNEIAEAMNFSPDYVSKIFKKETGITLTEYISRCRIERAKELIDEGRESIGMIAERLGYSSFSYFSEMFKRQTGYLPSSYRHRTE